MIWINNDFEIELKHVFTFTHNQRLTMTDANI
jgi:hypothetical protein